LALVPWLVLTAGPASAAGAWSVKTVAKVDAAGARCVLQSARESLSDGYQTTWAQVTVDASAVRVTSASDLDPGSGDIGMGVDDGAVVPMDRLEGPKTAVFESRHAALIEQFRRGLSLRVRLRFWPTWPTTGVHSVTFSLIGFTRAHAQATECK
jgi:hypothetical protein